MFEAIELLINDLFERHIENYEDFEKKIYWTSPDTRNGYKTTIDDVLSAYENYEDEVSYLKDCILQIIFLFNDSGIKIFLDKFKERLDYIAEENELDKIKIFRGRRIKPLKEPILSEYFFPNPSNYSTETLEFDIEEYSSKFLKARLDFITEIKALIDNLRTERAKVAQPLEKDEDIIVLKPTFCGMSLNINKLWKKMRKKKNSI